MSEDQVQPDLLIQILNHYEYLDKEAKNITQYLLENKKDYALLLWGSMFVSISNANKQLDQLRKKKEDDNPYHEPVSGE